MSQELSDEFLNHLRNLLQRTEAVTEAYLAEHDLLKPEHEEDLEHVMWHFIGLLVSAHPTIRATYGTDEWKDVFEALREQCEEIYQAEGETEKTDT